MNIKEYPAQDRYSHQLISSVAVYEYGEYNMHIEANTNHHELDVWLEEVNNKKIPLKFEGYDYWMGVTLYWYDFMHEGTPAYYTPQLQRIATLAQHWGYLPNTYQIKKYIAPKPDQVNSHREMMDLVKEDEDESV